MLGDNVVELDPIDLAYQQEDKPDRDTHSHSERECTLELAIYLKKKPGENGVRRPMSNRLSGTQFWHTFVGR